MGRGKSSVPGAIFRGSSPARRGVNGLGAGVLSSSARKFRGLRNGLMQRRKPFASNVALVTALLLSGQTIALADKGGKGPSNPAIPNVNLGLAAIPKVGVGLGMAAAAPTTIPPTGNPSVAAMPVVAGGPPAMMIPAAPSMTNPPTLPPSAAASAAPKLNPASMPTGGPVAGQAAGSGASAQGAAPGAMRSVSSTGLAPPGLNGNPGVGSANSGPSGANPGQGAQNSASGAGAFPPGPNGNPGKGAENSASIAGAFPPGQTSSGPPGRGGNQGGESSGRGAEHSASGAGAFPPGQGSSDSSGQSGGQGQGNSQGPGQGPDNPAQGEIVARAQPNERSQARSGPLPTCR